MTRIALFCICATVSSFVVLVGIEVAGPVNLAAAEARSSVPLFEVDAAWPRPLPHNWIIGEVSGLAVDRRDDVWLVHRKGTLTAAETAASTTPPAAECCVPAPAVVEFDPLGNVVQAWGGESGAGFQWPEREHGISLDPKGNVWVSSSGTNGTYILKFTPTGQFVRQIGQRVKKGGGNNDTATLGGPAQMSFDAQTNEVFVADGEGNRRVIVFDAETGAYKRHWGAYGERPDDVQQPKYSPSAAPSRQFSIGVHCIAETGGLLYVCDRGNDRLQIFRKDGRFVNEVFVAKQTLGVGSVWGIDFSPDKKFMYVADGTNEKVWILLRDDMRIVGSFGRAGRNAGQFLELHDLAVDSKGNIYTGEANANGGKRVQKFNFRGLGTATN